MTKSILFMVNSTFIAIKEYIKDYKLTSIFFLISVISFIAILFVARNDLNFENGKTTVFFDDNGSIYNLQVMMEYISPGKDKLDLSFCVNPKGRDKFDYTFSLSNNLELLSERGDKVKQIFTPRNSKDTIYTYSFSQKNYCMGSTFIGNIYGKHIFDKNLDLYIALSRGAKLLNGKVIIETRRINVNNIYPVKYSNKRSYVTEYNMPPDYKNHEYSYVLQGQDQKELYHNQLKNFDRGILLGILLSIITGVIIDFSFFYDRRRLRKKHEGAENEN